MSHTGAETVEARPPHTIAGVLLAAGLSTRMGTPKALLDWGGRPLVVYQLEQLRLAGCDPLLLVTGHAAEDVEAAASGSGATIVRNPAYREGRATSVRAAAMALPTGLDAILLLNVDQPRRAETLASLMAAHRHGHGPISVPVFEGRRGHPAIFASTLLDELRAVDEASEGLRAVSRRHTAARTEVDFPSAEVLLDCNDPAAYERALAFWAR
ncbi:MAG TPA: nucleotidyltransferase family protein [Dehalococcoidia bacterium]|nr:nucleotidyltransferase family protein [Dehalococcoidia bacterium]